MLHETDEPMTASFQRKILLLTLLAAAPAAALGADPAKPPAEQPAGPRLQLSVPLFATEFGSVAVAKVGDETITVRDFAQLLADTHADHGSAAGKQGDFRPVLDRLIDVRLITLEARAMGMAELPAVAKAVEGFRTSTLRETIRGRVARAVKADPEAVERRYRDAVREWKVQSVLFEKEGDAKAFAGAAGAATFARETARLVEEGKARSRVESQVFGRSKALPAVVEEVEKLSAGQVSAPIHVNDGWAVLLLEEVLYPDVPAARAEAERAIADPLRAKAVMDHYRKLLQRWAKLDAKLLASIDYEAKKPGLARLAKDRRALARIAGEAPITVADLTAELQQQFFHGLEQAAKEKKVNARKEQFLDNLVVRRLIDKEARAEGIPESEEYRRAVAEYERSLLFSAFVERAVVPEVKVTEAEARAYYDGHQDEFRYPELYRLETLAFARADDSQAACAKIRAGTDVKWLKANADDQLAPSKRTVQIDGTSVTTASMPQALVTALAGTKRGDCRVYARADGESYAVFVAGKTERQVQPFEEARPGIDRKLFEEKVVASVGEWARKLRKGYEVKVFITGLGV